MTRESADNLWAKISIYPSEIITTSILHYLVFGRQPMKTPILLNDCVCIFYHKRVALGPSGISSRKNF